MLGAAALYLLALIASGIFVAAAIALTAFALGEQYGAFPLIAALGEIAWSTSSEFTLLAVPLFILMGELLTRAGVTDRMYRALNPWVSWLPGGLMHTNIFTAALFAATSGSSVATAATVTTVSLPNLERNKYAPSLFLGTLAAGGTLGILIPPSINLIIFGLIAEVSVGDLYLAALIPGVMLAALYSALVLGACIAVPRLGGVREGTREMPDMRATLTHLVPPFGLFAIVVGSIYAGLATASEAAALGVLAALALVTIRRQLTWQVLFDALERTMTTTCMVMLVVLAAFFLTFVMGAIGLTGSVVEAVAALELSKYELIVIIVAIYLVLGCFLDPISMMIATAPVVVPVVVAAGFDPVWFGIVFMVLTEAALITPPIGMNLFVVQSIRRTGSIQEVMLGASPFMVMMLLMIALLVAFPGLATWLPAAAAR